MKNGFWDNLNRDLDIIKIKILVVKGKRSRSLFEVRKENEIDFLPSPLL